MTDISTGWVTRLALAFLLASTMVIAGGSSIAAAVCAPEDGDISGCEGDISTVESIGGNVFSVVEAGLIFAGLTFLALGMIFWASGGFSATMKSKGGFFIGGGILLVFVAFTFDPMIGLLDWIATDGV